MGLLLHITFWIAAALIVYAYVGYAAYLMVLSRLQSRFLLRGPEQPQVSVVMAAHNEAHNLPAKLASLYGLTYPREKLEIVVVSDGSTDGTNELLLAERDHVRAIVLPKAGGKAQALNRAVAEARGELLVFMDARQLVEKDAIAELVSLFFDPNVGAVSGKLHLETADGQSAGDALGIYWKIEKIVRKLESKTGSVVGVTGALFAMRRDLYVPLPAGTLLDDVLTPMQVAKAGKRVLFLESAVIRDRIFVQPGKEFGRKVRTLTGNYQLLTLAPWLLSFDNPLLFRFISHKLLRLGVPFLLLLLFAIAAILRTAFFEAAFALQVCFYVLAAVGAMLPSARRYRFVSIPYTFAMLNCAAAVAFYNFLTGRVRWA